MRILKIFVLSVICFLATAPNVYAVFMDEGKGDENPGLIEEAQMRKIYREMVEEKKRLSAETRANEKKRKALLTPFVYDTPEEMADLEKYRRLAKDQKGQSSKKLSSKIPVVSDLNVDEEISDNIIMNLAVISLFLTAIIFMPFYLRRKK